MIGFALEAASDSVAVSGELTLDSLVDVARLQLGGKHVMYYAHQCPGHSFDDPFLKTTYSDDWLRRYRERNYMLTDPVITGSLASPKPIDWISVSARDEATAEFFADARAYGVGPVGISFPVSGPVGFSAVFSLTFDAEVEQWSRLKRARFGDMIALASAYHSAVVEIKATEIEPVASLSLREIECVKWASEGKTNRDTADVLGLSEATVRMFLDRARIKMNCLNKTHLITKAIRLGIIS